ncbi:helix-turn-helix domain-containing protein [Planomicrobium okeanokoites]|uniref:Helix-turn-helix domain-containing protein n=1 Tax=Planomicrobium okeanokoites TaxID=244 RepID=A0ABV7KLD1_PLAOK|nr:helix-turn-helix transcriptional regulator [Planomicrobium okeanokoites]TAA69335.1 XRE family transcriptional regulator [Planomicrobium okeanokoites]
MEFNAKNFGQILRFLREHDGLSMLSLGKKLGTSASRIKSWENGDSVPSAKWIVMLSSVLDVPVDVLLITPKEEIVHYSDAEWDDIMNGVGPGDKVLAEEPVVPELTKADYLERLLSISSGLTKQDVLELYTLAKVKAEKGN